MNDSFSVEYPGSRERMSAVLDRLASASSKGDEITLQSLIDSFDDRSHIIAILFLTIPFIQPVPMLGLSTIFGAAIITIASTYILGKKPWVPEKFGKKEMPQSLLKVICEKGSKVFLWLEHWVRPRGNIFHRWSGMKTLAAICVIFCAVLLALPIPIPASNTVPAIPIILLALGLLEEDGWFIMAGYIATAFAVTFFGLIFIGPFFGLNFLVESGFIDRKFIESLQSWFERSYNLFRPQTI